MFLILPKLLDEESLSAVDAILETAEYTDGAATAGAVAKKTKDNLQLDREKTPDAAKLDEIILGALWKNASFRAAAIPRKILPTYVSKYTEGMSYGVHVDNPVIVSGETAVRTDISMTLFLSDPESYEGGELSVKSDTGETRIKLPKGDGVIYPTGELHAVRPVTAGERICAVTWIQSMVADPTRRRIAYELDLVCQSIAQKMPDSEEHRVLGRTYGNLLRLWGEV